MNSVAQGLKALLGKPDDLSSVPGTTEEGQNPLIDI